LHWLLNVQKSSFIIISNITCSNLVLFFCCAAAIVSGGKGTAQDKIKALKEAGVAVVESPAKIGSKMFEIFKQRGMVE
jgi:succinyl-CoA synthetase alpha subunit